MYTCYQKVATTLDQYGNQGQISNDSTDKEEFVRIRLHMILPYVHHQKIF